jgi:ribonuclease P protein component
LENKQRYTLGKTERLKSRKTIDGLFKNGKSFSLFPFRVVYRYPEASASGPLQTENTGSRSFRIQAGFNVSKRYFKKAVDRNRIKRLMKESYRLQKQPLNDILEATEKKIVVFFIFTGNEIPDYKQVFEKMTDVIKRLQKIVNAKEA